jgi:hypothetical protein
LNPIPSSTRASECQRAIAVVYGILCHVLFGVAVAELLEPPWQAAREAAVKRTSFFAHILMLSA